MNTIGSLPVQGSLFPSEVPQEKSSLHTVDDKRGAPLLVIADEDFHDDHLPWGQKGESLL